MRSIIIEFHNFRRFGCAKDGGYVALSIGFMTIILSQKSLMKKLETLGRFYQIHSGKSD